MNKESQLGGGGGSSCLAPLVAKQLLEERRLKDRVWHWNGGIYRGRARARDGGVRERGGDFLIL